MHLLGVKLRTYRGGVLHVTTGTIADSVAASDDRQIEWRRIAPWLVMQAACLMVFVVGWSPVAVAVAVGLYLIRMFAVTAFYHRYFGHRSYKMSRPMQFAGALLGATAVQRGALWWAAHHRKHHRSADAEGDPHSPHMHGFWWSQIGWFVTRGAWRTDMSQVQDFAKFPELVWLDRHDRVVPAALFVSLALLGWGLESFYPQLGTSASQMLVWGFCISTTVLFHVTASINTFAHLFGRRVWPTRDKSRNSFLLALLTLGEGWHNNHHWHPGSVQQGFRWWQIDITYYVLRTMAVVGLVSGIRPLPDRVRR
ncbi:MAG: stearoyl-CoA desaturase (delta-9 desaturase) [Hyphomicrobiaceae bacterium]